MTRLQEAVRRDLAVAPEAPPVERIHRRARRRRIRWGAAGLVTLVAMTATAAIVIRSARPERNSNVAVVGGPTSVSPTTVATTRPPDALLPVASETIFPGLVQVMQQVHGYETADGPLTYGEIVATTRNKTYAVFGGRIPIDTRPIYLVRLVGTFTCDGCSTPSNKTPAPHGTEILFIFSPVPTDPTHPLGGFSIGDQQTDLSQFGTVYRLPSTGTDNGPLTRPIVTMKGCVPAWADQGSGTVKLFSLPNPIRTVQVLANPTRGIAGPYAIVERFFKNASPIGAPAPAVVNINGRLASVYIGIYGQGNVVWTLPDDSEVYIRTRGFDQTQLIAIAPRCGRAQPRHRYPDSTWHVPHRSDSRWSPRRRVRSTGPRSRRAAHSPTAPT